MVQINLLRTRTSGWKAEVVLTYPREPYTAPREVRHMTEEVRPIGEGVDSDALARRAVLELAHFFITEHFRVVLGTRSAEA